MFERTSVQKTLGSVIDYEVLACPEGVRLPDNLQKLVQDLPLDLALKKLAVATPWAVQEEDGAWEEDKSPRENLEIFEISPEKMSLAKERLFDQQIPFLGLLTRTLPTPAELDLAFSGAPYSPFQTIAVYSQTDSKPIPDIYFFHWLEVNPLGEKNTKSLDAAAKELSGAVVFAQRVDAIGTSQRPHPDVSFDMALNTRVQHAVGETTIAVPEITIEAAPVLKKPSAFTTLAIGVTVASLVVFTYTVAKRKKA